MTRSGASTIVASAAVKRDGAHEQQPACLACGARIGSAEPTIKIRGALVHMRCAVYRRRLVKR
jgi:hypothetical protein